MFVTVVIVGFRNPSDIQTCLAALAASNHTDFGVLICENGGPDAYRALVEALPARLPGGQPVEVIEAPGNIGYGGGVNLAMAKAPDAGAWWVLNPDTAPQPEALAACVARLERGDCEAVGATIYLSSGRVQAYGGHWQMLLGRAVTLGSGMPLGSPVDADNIERRQSFISGACMLVSRRFLETVGPMREDYFLYCEEVEWCLRGSRLGMRLGFAPQALIRHEAGATTGSGERFARMPRTPDYLNERNKILLTRDLSPALVPVMAVCALLMLTLRFGGRGASRQMGFALQGWLAGMRNQRGAPAWIPGVPGRGSTAPRVRR